MWTKTCVTHSNLLSVAHSVNLLLVWSFGIAVTHVVASNISLVSLNFKGWFKKLPSILKTLY